MNKINPLIVIAILALVLIILIYEDNKISKQIDELNKELATLEAENSEIARKSSIWKDEKKDKQTIENLLSSNELSNAKVHKNIIKNIYKFEIEMLDEKGSDFVTNKILNSTLKLKSIELSRIEENNLSFLSLRAEIEL